MVGCTTSDLVCTSCSRGEQENSAIVLVALQTAEILEYNHMSFPMHDN